MGTVLRAKLSDLWNQPIRNCKEITTCYFVCQYAEKEGTCALSYDRTTCPKLKEEFYGMGRT